MIQNPGIIQCRKQNPSRVVVSEEEDLRPTVSKPFTHVRQNFDKRHYFFTRKYDTSVSSKYYGF